MKNKISKIICCILVVVWCMCFLCYFTVNASYEKKDDVQLHCAENLYRLGLFKGVGTDSSGNPDFALDKLTTRSEAITMLIRVLGEEGNALSSTFPARFTDVPEWAEAYVGYAYGIGLTKGVSETLFGGNDSVSATQCATFVLRALGYSSETDFNWECALELSDKLKITNGIYTANTNLKRGDLVYIFHNALYTNMKGSGSHTLMAAKSSHYCVEQIMRYISIENKIYLLNSSMRFANDFSKSPYTSFDSAYRELKIGKLGSDYYIDITSLEEFLSLVTKSFSYGGVNEPYSNDELLAGGIEAGGETKVWPNETDQYAYSEFKNFEQEIWKKNEGLNSFYFSYAYKMGKKVWEIDGKKLMELSPDTIYVIDNIRCFVDYNAKWFSVDDILEYFSINVLVELDEVDGTTILRIVYGK